MKKPPKNYQASRFNATRHGVLSRDTILPWEDREEYEKLLRSLTQENAPVGTIEAQLVEEIAGIFWRKRRLWLAETSAFRNQYRRLLTLDSNNIAEAALFGVRILMDSDPDLPEVFTMTSEEAARELKVNRSRFQHSLKALKILEGNSPDSYQRALKALDPDCRKSWKEELANGEFSVQRALKDLFPDINKVWEEEVENEEPSVTRGDFEHFVILDISKTLKRIDLLANHSSIMAQAQGEAFDSERLEKLARYEVHLDRKMKSTLGMLIQLQDRREKRKPAIEVACGS